MRYNFEEKPKMISDDCFRLLSLRLEVQNDVEVVKAVLEELEVMRLSCSLGMLSSVNIKDFKHDMLEAREFDGDFARFLRNDVFNRASKDSDNFDEDMDQDKCDGVKVMSLFGKQSEVQKELARLGCWSEDYDSNLQSQDQGIYCAHLKTPHSTVDAKGRVLVLFTWIQDVLFEPQRLRDTATYILRFLTCLSPNIVCCLSAADVEKIQHVVADLTSGSSQEWKSYSVAFYVEKQEDEKDEVRCEHFRSIDLFDIPTGSNQRMVKGSFPAMVVISPVPATTRTMKVNVEFDDVKEYARWLAKHAEKFKLHVNYSPAVATQCFRNNFVKAANMIPEDAFELIEQTFERNTNSAEEQSKEEANAFVEEQLSAFDV
uniref:Uncharacterized protein n=1 Tax=Globisporangium ultimum (strain ATCC 200006 / CBS 805.95 / DAOM BR144) TaxID=431595 RepID=K3X2J4_GLOUD